MNPHIRRLVPLQGASNFRDLGGYTGHHGRSVRWGKLYRSDHLGQLTTADHAELRLRGVTQALDFRGAQESAASPYSLAGLRRHALHIEPTVVQRMHDISSSGQRLDEATTVGLMEALYRSIVRHQTSQLAAFFGHLLARETSISTSSGSAASPATESTRERASQSTHPLANNPANNPATGHALVFHCTAGKDRTGIAAALLLSALGVPRDVVMQDFLLTNQVFRPPQRNHHALPDEALQVLWSVRPQYLQAAWQVIDDERGGVAAYLRRAMGVSQPALEELSRRYLEPL